MTREPRSSGAPRRSEKARRLPARSGPPAQPVSGPVRGGHPHFINLFALVNGLFPFSQEIRMN
jgi:hypothetical protein